jgi:tetratricopeptide (TPR) repeat protein
MRLFLEVIALRRELIKFAPASLQLECYIISAKALMGLQKLDEAEEMVHEALATCDQDGVGMFQVGHRMWTQEGLSPSQVVHRGPHWSVCSSQVLRLLTICAIDRGDWEAALLQAQRALPITRQDFAENLAALAIMTTQDFAEKLAEQSALSAESFDRLRIVLVLNADILEALGRVDEALAIDAQLWAIDPTGCYMGALVRRAVKHIAAGEDDEAERILWDVITRLQDAVYEECSSQTRIETVLKQHILLAELLERRGTEEALAKARTLRDEVAQQLARHEARMAAALEEMRAEAAEVIRQWREERIKAREKKKGGEGKNKGKNKGKGKKKGKRSKAKPKGESSAAAIEAGPPRETAGGEAEGAAAAEAEQQAPGGEAEPREEEEEDEREECAVCLQDLELEDEGGEGEALVVLKCGHRFHAICGDMWCAKCADKGWGVTCPGCRAPYVVVR